MTKSFTVLRCVAFLFLAMVSVPLWAQNQPPVIVSDTVIVAENSFVNGNILTNDSDPDGAVLTASATLALSPTHGTLFIQSSGLYSYIPFANYSGPDMAIITVCDTGTPVQCGADTLYITVTHVNSAPIARNDTGTTRSTIPLTGSAATNDSDIDGPAAIYTLASPPVHGTATIDSAGTYTYASGLLYTGLDSFSYSLCDGGTPDLCDTAYVIVTVTTLNQPPVAVNDTFNINEDSVLTASVGTNDSDPDGPSAIYGIFSPPAHGSVNLQSNGTFTYTPAANYNGTDSFSYVHCDGGTPNLCDTATVYFNLAAVNDAPVAADDYSTTTENTAVSGDVSTNDSDVDGPGATYTTVSSPAHGTLALNADGTYTYTPATGYTGCDTMSVSRCDGGAPDLCDTSLLTICVTLPVVANSDSAVATQGQPVVIPVTANDTTSAATTVSLITAPGHGSAVTNGDNTVTYASASDYYGIDSISYAICDTATSICDTAEIYIVVTGGPGFSIDPVTVLADSSADACFTYGLYGDTTAIVVTVSCASGHGTATVVSQNQLTGQVCVRYVVDSNYTGADSFCVTVCDTLAQQCHTVSVPVTVTERNTNCYWLKGISPNGDGQNDNFMVNCNDQYPQATLKVFNRWGDQVWDSGSHYANNFEGKNGRGEVLPDGTYYYIYLYNDGTKGQHVGFIQITR
ncbi:MAG: tandem-95 repeat protein [Bacteroidetes bacterium]|nr:tandem-95 repeat protein [Bacteroidota bacterium]